MVCVQHLPQLPAGLASYEQNNDLDVQRCGKSEVEIHRRWQYGNALSLLVGVKSQARQSTGEFHGAIQLTCSDLRLTNSR